MDANHYDVTVQVDFCHYAGRSEDAAIEVEDLMQDMLDLYAENFGVDSIEFRVTSVTEV